MANRRAGKRIAIVAFCLLLLVFFAGSAFLSASHSGHDCQQEQEHCPVCVQIQANRLLRQGLLFGLCFPLLFLFVRALDRCARPRAFLGRDTLVSQHIKLSC